MAKVYFDLLKHGGQLQREEALVVASAILECSEAYDVDSICEVLGHPEMLEELTTASELAKISRAQKAELKKKEDAERFLKSKKREDDKKRKAIEEETKKEARTKASQVKAEAQRKQNESRKGRTIFTVKGLLVDDITTIIPAVCGWLAAQDSVYVSSGVLSKWRDSREGMQTVSVENLGSLLGMGFSFKSVRSTMEGEVDEFMAQCPTDIRSAILGTEYYHGIREVDAVLDRPIVMRDGTVVGTTKGHDKSNRILFSRDFERQDVPLNEAYSAIFDIFSEFPQKSVPGALALIFTELMRPCLPTAPMVFVNAPALGSGKSLMARCCLAIVNKNSVSPLPQPSKVEEFDQQVKSMLLKYPGRTLFFDDFAGIIDYQILKTLLTDPNGFEFRVLGQPKMFHAKTNFTLVMTGNNATLCEELERRCFKIQVDTGVEHPSLRKTRRNTEQLRVHVEDNHDYLLSCAITILSDALKNLTEEHTTRQMGSFEVWVDTVARSVVYSTNYLKKIELLHAEICGDVTPDMQEYVSRLDDTGEILALIYDEMHERSWFIRELSTNSTDRLNELLGTTGDTHNNITRAKRLQKYTGRPRKFGSATYRLDHLGSKRWQITIVEGTTVPQDPQAGTLDYHLDAKNLTTGYN